MSLDVVLDTQFGESSEVSPIGEIATLIPSLANFGVVGQECSHNRNCIEKDGCRW